MKAKGNVKKVDTPVFWTKNKEKVTKELEDFVLNQYFSKDTLSIYCDMSMVRNEPLMSVACSYVSNSSINVKHQLLYTRREVIDKNIYAEINAVKFALENFHKYIKGCNYVNIYSDILIIEDILSGEIVFKKNNSIENCRKELSNLYKRKVRENPELTISIIPLYPEFKKYNPFHRSAHNSARKILIDREI